MATLSKFRKPPCSWQDIVSHYHHTKKTSSLLIDSSILPPTFKALTLLNYPPQIATSLHADVIKLGLLHSSVSTSNSLLSFYMKSSMPESASSLFRDMPAKDSVTWNAMLNGFFALGFEHEAMGLFIEAWALGFVPNTSTLVLTIHSCWKLRAFDNGRNIHGFVLKAGLAELGSIRNSLLSFYVKSDDLSSARELFEEMLHRDVIAYSVLISGYARSGDYANALRVFRMVGVSADGLAMVSVLQACGGAEDAGLGRMVHAHVVRRGFESDLFVGNSVVDMYSKCRDVDSALRAFGLMPGTNVVSWNSLLSGLVRSEMYREVLELFSSMREAGVEGDEVSIVNLLQACKKLRLGVWCKCIHSVVIRRSLESNEFVLNSLLDAYAKCDLIGLASRLFDRLERKDVISWSTMIAGFANCGEPDKAITLFLEMRLANEAPNSVTMLSLLEACTVSAELKLGKSAHGLVIRNCFVNELAIGTALVDMYAKCGDSVYSTRVFDVIPNRNILSWNALIGGLGMNGRTSEALAVFNQMESKNVKPNRVTMLSVLSVCNHGGLVKEGLSYFHRMKQDPLLQPGLEHYSCVVDMLGRAGDLDGALEVIEGMPEGLVAGKAAWTALLSACRSHGNLELGQLAAARVLELEPTNSSGYLLMSSMYAKGGLKEEMASMRGLIKEGKLRLASGCSWVHVEQRSHKFFSWDGSHSQCEEIYDTVGHLHDCIRYDERDDGYGCILQ